MVKTKYSVVMWIINSISLQSVDKENKQVTR